MPAMYSQWVAPHLRNGVALKARAKRQPSQNSLLSPDGKLPPFPQPKRACYSPHFGFWGKVKRLCLDKGFYRTDVLKGLKEMDIPFRMAARIGEKIERLWEEERAWLHPYTVEDGEKERVEVRVRHDEAMGLYAH